MALQLNVLLLCRRHIPKAGGPGIGDTWPSPAVDQLVAGEDRAPAWGNTLPRIR